MLRELTGIATHLLLNPDTLGFLEDPKKLTFFHLSFVFFLSRMLVYEYVDNGNLDQWLHGDVGEVSPLTWDIRINIILGTAKGYPTLV